MKEWRSFDYIFVVVYPADREADVMSLLGSYADDKLGNASRAGPRDLGRSIL